MILAPTLLLNAGSGAAIARPTFSRDFAGEKTLNNGTGPAITFTRGTNATYFDATGTLRFAPNNHIRNSQAGGSTNGVIGSGGALPLNWTASGTAANGVAVEIIGTGTEDGLAYVDLKFSGTPTTSSSAFLQFDSATQVVAANGQTWTGSAYVKLQGGSLTNVTQVRTFTSGRTSAGATVATQSQSTNFTPNGTALKLQRQIATFAMSDATVERVQNGVAFSYTNGNPIDLTLRIAAPQLELGSTATDYNPTNGTAYFGPRFDHDPATGASRGLLIEEARTNSIRNSQAGGATNGVIGSGGALPTNWTSSMPTGVSIEVAGTGTTGGFNYIDIKISGTNTSGSLGFANFGFESTAQVVASSGQTWTASAYVALTAGNFTNVNNPILQIVGRDPAIVETSSISLSTASSSLSRFAVTRTLSVGTTSRVWMRFDSTIDNAAAVDFTLRIAAPQLEQGAFPTSYIPTTTAAATRAADSAVVTPIASFYNQSEGTLFAEAPATYAQSADIVQFAEASSANNRFVLFFAPTGTLASFQYRTSGVIEVTGGVSVSSGAIAKIAAAFAANDARSAVNGTLTTADTSVTLNSANTHMVLGRLQGAASYLNGHIRKIAYWPRRLSNTLLQQLTT